MLLQFSIERISLCWTSRIFPTPISIVYEPEDLFAVYEEVLAVNLTSPNWDQSTPFSFLLTIVTFLEGDATTKIQEIGASREIRLQEFLATPIVIFSDAWLGRMVSDPDMGKALVLATSSYRVLP